MVLIIILYLTVFFSEYVYQKLIPLSSNYDCINLFFLVLDVVE